MLRRHSLYPLSYGRVDAWAHRAGRTQGSKRGGVSGHVVDTSASGESRRRPTAGFGVRCRAGR
ncbi:hypothetical protein FAIPA1_20393 [Frankia sp. AiPs1]